MEGFTTDHRPLVICICGSTSSGKTTLSRYLRKKYDTHSVCQDQCRSKPYEELKKELKGNLECVESVDFVKFENEIVKEIEQCKNKKYLIVEGYLSCCEKPIIDKYFDIVIFLDTTDKEVAKMRRWERSTKKREFNEFSNLFDDLMWTYYLKYRFDQMNNVVLSGKNLACINVNNLDAKQVQQKVIELLEGYGFQENNVLNLPNWYLSEKDALSNQLQLSDKQSSTSDLHAAASNQGIPN